MDILRKSEGPQVTEIGHKIVSEDVTAFGYILTYLNNDGSVYATTYKICLEEDNTKYDEREVLATTDFDEFVKYWSNPNLLV